MSYSESNVRSATLKYFNGNDLATDVWMNKYALRNELGGFEELTPDDMHSRLAQEFNRIESKFNRRKTHNHSLYGQARPDFTEDIIYRLFEHFKYVIPQGSVMSMLGNTNQVGSLSNCFVIDSPHDSYGGIMYADEQLTALMKRRAGVGLDISKLRPAGVTVKNAAKTSTGAVSFMHRFSNTTREVAQSGRRGALMITMDIRHPDIFEFVSIKADNTSVTGANISVQITDDFMKAVKSDDLFTLQWPIDVPLSEAKITKQIKALDLWKHIIYHAHTYAEPGIMFKDRMLNYAPDGVYDRFKFITSNPCGEIGMGANDSCRLMAVNLYSLVRNPFSPNASLNKKLAYRIFYETQRLADNLVELELEYIDRIIAKIKSDPEPDSIKATELKTWEDVRQTTALGRRTGSGFTALGDMLAALGIKYDSNESLVVQKQLATIKFRAELDASVDLAIERGAFPSYSSFMEVTNPYWETLGVEFSSPYHRMLQHGRRNVSFSTIAPTGTVSMMAKIGNYHGSTGGIEPLFAGSYQRRTKVHEGDADYHDESGDGWITYTIFHEGIKEWADRTEYPIGEWGTKSSYVESHKIDWDFRVKVQALWQRYITHSISSTINLPENISIEKVGEIYMDLFDNGAKGGTVYRENSRFGVLLTGNESLNQDSNIHSATIEYRGNPVTVISSTEGEIVLTNAPKRPTVLPSYIHKVTINGEPRSVIIGLLNNVPYEVFVTRRIDHSIGELVKMGSGHYKLQSYEGHILSANVTSAVNMSDVEAALTRLASSSLRHGASIKFVAEQLRKSGGLVVSFTSALARVLDMYVEDGVSVGDCPDCGGNLRREEGCTKCESCSYSVC